MAYSKRLIFDYINGNTIEDYDIDALENDWHFMMEVMRSCHDFRLYNLCSDNVKHNHEFVIFLVDFFKDKTSFIIKVANEYLKYIDDREDIRYLEMSIMVGNILRRKSEYQYNQFSIQSSANYLLKRIEIEMVKKNQKDGLVLDYIGLGFVIVASEYATSNIILNFYAKFFLNEIFYSENNPSLKEVIHHNFASYDALIKKGMMNFLINYISLFDKSLASYVACHLELLDDVKKDLVHIGQMWNYHTEIEMERKINIFLQELGKYMEQKPISLTMTEIINYISKKLKLGDIFSFGNISSSEEIDIENLTLPDRCCLNFAFKLAHDLFKKNIIDDTPDDYDNQYQLTKDKTTIVPLNSNYFTS